VSNGQWTFHGVPRVIILVAKNLMIKINPNEFFILKTQQNKMTRVHKLVV